MKFAIVFISTLISLISSAPTAENTDEAGKQDRTFLAPFLAGLYGGRGPSTETQTVSLSSNNNNNNNMASNFRGEQVALGGGFPGFYPGFYPGGYPGIYGGGYGGGYGGPW
jgi:hypothetical protein